MADEDGARIDEVAQFEVRRLVRGQVVPRLRRVQVARHLPRHPTPQRRVIKLLMNQKFPRHVRPTSALSHGVAHCMLISAAEARNHCKDHRPILLLALAHQPPFN